MRSPEPSIIQCTNQTRPNRKPPPLTKPGRCILWTHRLIYLIVLHLFLPYVFIIVIKFQEPHTFKRNYIYRTNYNHAGTTHKSCYELFFDLNQFEHSKNLELALHLKLYPIYISLVTFTMQV